MNENSKIFDLKIDRNNLGELLEQCRKKEEFTDVKLKIGDKLFHAHRSVLSLYSPVLKAMISDQWSKEGVCEVGDEYVDVEIMEDLLSFLYTGNLRLTPDNVHSFCVAAHFLQITILLDSSVKHLSKQIIIENVLTLFLFSISCQLEMLRKSCLRFIQSEHEKVFQESSILKFSFENFKDLIEGLKDQTCDSVLRENTFHCIVRWTENNLAERSDHLPILLENIPLEELSFEFLTKTVSAQQLVIQSIFCAQALIKAFGKLQLNSQLKAKENLIVIGGMELKTGNQIATRTSSMSCYCPETKIWRDLPNMKQARAHFAAVVSDKQDIIVCGGYVYVTSNITTDQVEMFDWNAQTWKDLPKLPFRLGSTLIAIYDGYLYVAGGDSGNGEPLKTVLRYSFQTKQWEYVTNMNVARADGFLLAYKNHLYAIGGSTNAVERYDPLLDEWQMMASMNKSHKWLGATVHLDKFYVCSETGFEVYDPEKNIWTCLSTPILGRGTSLVSMNGKLLAVGGLHVEDRVKSNSICEFNLSTNQWSEFSRMYKLLSHHCSVVGHFN